MNEVEAVKTQSQREQIEHLLHGVYLDVWKFGLNTALRISDLLSITMAQAKSIDQDTLELTIVEQKTGKDRVLTLNRPAMRIILARIKANPKHVYLFQSTSPRNHPREPKPFNRRSIGREFARVGKLITPCVQLSTHSMRKTRGFSLHQNGMSIELIRKVFNHSSTETTMRYIGVDAEAVKNSYTDLEL